MPAWMVFVRAPLPVHFLPYFARTFERYHVSVRLDMESRLAGVTPTFALPAANFE